MPGKPDGAKPSNPPYFPGSGEYRAYDEGWRARYALQARDTNPHDPTTLPAEYGAWDTGWGDADANAGGAQRMPATTGAPGVIPP